jgi:predicted protein tyrosine phosphatase
LSIDYNRLSVVENPYQGQYKRVLCVCSGGVLRSPTTAWILSNDPYNHNTRSAGTEDYALIPVDEALLTWAEEIVCMEERHAKKVLAMVKEFGLGHEKDKSLHILKIPDNFRYRDSRLIEHIKKAYNAATGEKE